jgi:hypothetical protein
LGHDARRGTKQAEDDEHDGEDRERDAEPTHGAPPAELTGREGRGRDSVVVPKRCK